MGDLTRLLNVCNHTEPKIRNCKRVSTVWNLSAQKVSGTHRELISRTGAAPALQRTKAASPPSCLPWRRIGGSNNLCGRKLQKWKEKWRRRAGSLPPGSDGINDTAWIPQCFCFWFGRDDVPGFFSLLLFKLANIILTKHLAASFLDRMALSPFICHFNAKSECSFTALRDLLGAYWFFFSSKNKTLKNTSLYQNFKH